MKSFTFMNNLLEISQEEFLTLQRSLTQTCHSMVNIVDDIAVVIWLIQTNDNLAVVAHADAGSAPEQALNRKSDDIDFVVACFKEGKIKKRDELTTADFVAFEYAHKRRCGRLWLIP